MALDHWFSLCWSVDPSLWQMKCICFEELTKLWVASPVLLVGQQRVLLRVLGYSVGHQSPAGIYNCNLIRLASFIECLS